MPLQQREHPAQRTLANRREGREAVEAVEAVESEELADGDRTPMVGVPQICHAPREFARLLFGQLFLRMA